MTAIIPFESAKLPAHLATRRMEGLNKEVLGSGTVFPILSIKGKVFTLVKGKEKKVITREIDGEQEAVGSLQLTVARANTKYRVFYAEKFSEDGSDGKKPDCYSVDGIEPAADARSKQSKKCQGCAHNVWGQREGGVGTDCAVKTRLAVIDPVQMAADPEHEPLLLNVPAASRKSFAQAVDAAEQRGIDYNALVMRVSFDKEAASPKLIFKPVGWLDDATLTKVQALYENDVVREMMGYKREGAAAEPDAPAASEVDTSELEAAIAARKASEGAKKTVAETPAKPKVEEPELEQPKPAAKRATKPKVEEVEDAPVKSETKAAPAVSDAEDDTAALLADMEALLGNSDD